MKFILGVAAICLLFPWAASAETPPVRDAFAPLQGLIGTWKGTGYPEGTREEKQAGQWQETIQFIWKFTKAGAWVELKADNSKLLSSGKIERTNDGKSLQLTLTTPTKETQIFEISVEAKKINCQRKLGDGTYERLVFTALHDNRLLYRKEVAKLPTATGLTTHRVGLLKDGEPFVVVGNSTTECIVSGGKGTSTVTYMGKTYYVCCSGCRDEFNENPKRYVDEWEARQKKK
ncbi:MAG: YHS domain-containing protein [Zavarzinella sp.]